MNYQYIEQLIERYFSCQTTLQEEQILRTFFVSEDVPGHLMQYAELFRYENEAKQESLGSDFDEKMIALVGKSEKKTVTLQPGRRFTPFFRAAAVVAIVITVGSAADRAISSQSETSAESAIAIDPYIRQSDIQNTIRVKDVSQAEVKPQVDTLLVQPTEMN